MHVRPDISLYVTHTMLYRYCSIAFLIPNQEDWGLYPLLDTGAPGYLLRDGRETVVRPGNYVVLGRLSKYMSASDRFKSEQWDSIDKNPVDIQLNPENPPRRVPTRDRDTQSRSQGQSEKNQLVWTHWLYEIEKSLTLPFSNERFELIF
jgi:hypothetical protein